jgi:hypothetical protein
MKELYDRVTLVTRGELLSAERARAMVWMWRRYGI